MNKKLVFTTMAILLFGVTGVGLVPRTRATQTWNFHLYGNHIAGWGLNASIITNPGPTLQVYLGDTVNLTLTSQDHSQHEWFLDYNNNTFVDPDEPSSLLFSNTTTYSFVADTLGNFTYRCAVHPTAMIGAFEVWNPVPKFPAATILPLLMAVTVLAVVLRRKH